MEDAAERLAAITKIADALMDHLPGDNWSMAYVIWQIAQGERSAAEALSDLERN